MGWYLSLPSSAITSTNGTGRQPRVPVQGSGLGFLREVQWVGDDAATGSASGRVPSPVASSLSFRRKLELCQ